MFTILKYLLLLIFLILVLPGSAQNGDSKNDMNFKIISLVFLIGALILAIWKLKGTYKK